MSFVHCIPLASVFSRVPQLLSPLEFSFFSLGSG